MERRDGQHSAGGQDPGWLWASPRSSWRQKCGEGQKRSNPGSERLRCLGGEMRTQPRPCHQGGGGCVLGRRRPHPETDKMGKGVCSSSPPREAPLLRALRAFTVPSGRVSAHVSHSPSQHWLVGAPPLPCIPPLQGTHSRSSAHAPPPPALPRSLRASAGRCGRAAGRCAHRISGPSAKRPGWGRPCVRGEGQPGAAWAE